MEINKMKTKKTIQSINKTKNWFFERINNIHQPLANLRERKHKSIKL
jgi:hypothetical protein